MKKKEAIAQKPFDPGVQYRPISHAFGLDISDSSIQIAEMSRRGNTHTLEALNEASLPSGVVHQGMIQKHDVLVKTIRKLIQDTKISTRYVVLSAPHENVYLYPFEFPSNLTSHQILSAVQYEAEGVLPISLSGMYTGVQFHHSRDKRNHVLFAATPQNLVDDYIAVAREAGLVPVVMEADSLSIARSLIGSESEPVVFLDVSAWSSMVAIVERGMVHGFVSIAMGSHHIIEELTSELNMLEKDIEHLKKQGSFSDLPTKGKNIVKGKIKLLVKEIRKAAQYHESHTGRPIKELILADGFGLIADIPKLLTEETSLSVRIGNPINETGIVISEKVRGKRKDKIMENQVTFAQVLGLAMRGTLPDVVEGGVNLLPQSIQRRFKSWYVQRIATLTALLITTTMVVILAGFSMWFAQLSTHYTQLRQEVLSPEHRVALEEFHEVSQTAVTINRKTGNLWQFYDQRINVGSKIENILDVKTDSIQLVSLSYESIDGEGVAKITIRGVAETRNSLITFDHALRLQAQRVESSPRNFDAPRDAHFTIIAFYDEDA